MKDDEGRGKARKRSEKGEDRGGRGARGGKIEKEGGGERRKRSEKGEESHTV